MDFLEARGVKNVALLFTNNIAAEELLSVLKPLLTAKNIQSKEYRYNVDEIDFNILIVKLKNAGHDWVLQYGFLPGIALAYKEMKRQVLSK